jgi:hypothetical protein
MSYLTKEEKNFELDLLLLQCVLGLEYCKTRRDVMNILEEVYFIGYDDGKIGRIRGFFDDKRGET